ncbi:o-succinylbenzoate synthase [Peribacillus tepidiphilus]|uniref:o-succinylbenzoate synthase n=1 Tax=Peribacillus tepidiphilus TaxID=2652445 RepID=UPI0035B55865
MKLSKVNLHLISSPLKKPFETSLEVVRNREAIIVETIDHDGNCGYGEVVAFSSPWYTEETIKTCLHMLKDFLIPAIKSKPISHPSQLESIFVKFRGNRMAKAGLEGALWDLYAKQRNIPLYELFGGSRKSVQAGVVIASKSVTDAMASIEEYEKEGYQRYKIKISPESDLSFLKEIRQNYPHIPLMADANSAYSLKDLQHLKKLDEFNLMMIEQPLGHDDIVEHSELQQSLMTPICLDESITSYHAAKSALALKSCQIINIKMSRVGGWMEAIKIHNLCVKNNIPVWCGGMIEFGISRAHNLALATLPGFTIPGDLSSSSRFWEWDIIEPEIQVKNGQIIVPHKPGIGFEVNRKHLIKLLVHKESILLGR